MADAMLKKYNEFSKEQWDLLNSIPSYENINFTVFSVNNITRSFCKCGYISNKDLESCPKCGNNERYFKQTDYNPVINREKKIEYDEMTDTITLSAKEYSVKANYSTQQFEIKDTGWIVEYKIERGIITKSAHLRGYFDGYKISELRQILEPHLEDLETWQHANVAYATNNDCTAIYTYLEAKENYPLLMKDLKNYPGIIQTCINKKISGLTSSTTFDDLVKSLKMPSNEYIPYVESLLRRSKHSWYSRLNFFEFYDIIQTDELKKAVIYLLKHSSIDLSDYTNLLSNIKYSIQDKTNPLLPDEEKLLSKFLLSNFAIYKGSTLNRFLEIRSKVKDYGFTFTEEWLDKKNFNTLKNLKHLERTRYNPKRAKLFIDQFDLNPLASLDNLLTKRVPKKADLIATEEALDKKYS